MLIKEINEDVDWQQEFDEAQSNNAAAHSVQYIVHRSYSASVCSLRTHREATSFTRGRTENRKLKCDYENTF